MSVLEPMTTEPSEKTIKVYFVSRLLAPSDSATVIFPRVRDVQRSEFSIRDGLTATLRIPTRHFKLFIETFFPGSPEIVRVSAAVVGKQVDSLRISQENRRKVQIDIRHAESRDNEYCTVTCDATGESRTGVGACIDCKADRGIVRLCC